MTPVGGRMRCLVITQYCTIVSWKHHLKSNPDQMQSKVVQPKSQQRGAAAVADYKNTINFQNHHLRDCIRLF